MPAEPTDLAHALEQTLAQLLGGPHFDSALNGYTHAGEAISVTNLTTLSTCLLVELIKGVEIELKDEYSGRIETFRLVIEPVSTQATPALAAAA